MSTKLHEILAVESDRRSAATAILDETLVTLTKKPEHFIGKHAIYKAFDENDPENGEQSSKEIVDTVRGKLVHCFQIAGRAIDVSATKDATNQEAKAQIVIGGSALGPELPATTLLMLEADLKKWILILDAIPTLAPGRNWQPDAEKGPNIYKDANPEARFKTKKIIQHKVLVEATQHHPAQVEKWSEDVKVGKIVDTSWSSMMTPAQKSETLGRAHELLAAVKQARQRANAQEIKQVSIADALASYIIGG